MITPQSSEVVTASSALNSVDIVKAPAAPQSDREQSYEVMQGISQWVM